MPNSELAAWGEKRRLDDKVSILRKTTLILHPSGPDSFVDFDFETFTLSLEDDKNSLQFQLLMSKKKKKVFVFSLSF